MTATEEDVYGTRKLSPEVLDHPRAMEIMEQAEAKVRRSAEVQWFCDFRMLAPHLESPIELYFAYAAAATWPIGETSFTRDTYQMVYLGIDAQVQVANYRVDFKLWERLVPKGPMHRQLLIELDGHDFHERTKEQAARDRKRDRDLQALGYGVCRFTGSEVYRDPFACADEAVKLLRAAPLWKDPPA